MRRLSSLILLAALVTLVPSRHTLLPRAIGATCAARVAVLGADMSAGGRFEAQRALGVGPHTAQVSQSVADEWFEAHGLVPAGDLRAAVAAAVLRPLPSGAGLTVTLNHAITLDSAQTYANALLTAGILDADIGVAAPTSQPTAGDIAVLALLRAAPRACVAVSPARWDLAIREVVLSEALARANGRAAAPSLLLALKTDAVSRNLTAYAALESLITHDSAARHLRVPADDLLPLVAYLHDLVMSGAYARLAGAHLVLGGAAPLRATVRVASATPAQAALATPSATASRMSHGTLIVATNLGLTVQLATGVRDFRAAPGMTIKRNGVAGSFAALQAGDAVALTIDPAGEVAAVAASGAVVTRATATALPAAPAATAHTWRGTLVVASNEGVTAQTPGGGVRDVRVAPNVAVTRNGQRSSLDALLPGDVIVVTTDAGGVALSIAATSGAAAASAETATPAAAPATTSVLHGSVAVATNEGVTLQMSDGSVRDVRATPSLQVTRNGRSSSLAALQRGDSVTMWVDAAGTATALDASSPNASVAVMMPGPLWHGTLAAVWGAGIAARDRSGVRDFRLSAALTVSRNGVQSGLTALRAGDAITVTTTTSNATVATQVDAFSATAPASGKGNKAAELQAQNVGTALAMVVLLILTLALLIGVALWHRRQLARAAAEASRRQT